MVVKCMRRCWDSKSGRRYHPGDQDDIDPLSPIAGNFEFPPGTEVYWKKPGNKNEPAVSTTRIVPGLVPAEEKLKDVEKQEADLLKKLEALKAEKAKLAPEPAEIICDVCGEYKGTEKQVRMHKLNCKKKE